jgi:hypothetical protein
LGEIGRSVVTRLPGPGGASSRRTGSYAARNRSIAELGGVRRSPSIPKTFWRRRTGPRRFGIEVEFLSEKDIEDELLGGGNGED